MGKKWRCAVDESPILLKQVTQNYPMSATCSIPYPQPAMLRFGQLRAIPVIRETGDFRLQCNHLFGRLLSLITNKEVAVATNLVVRNVEEEVALALKQLAASHGRSAEAEHREILRSVLQRPKRRSVADVLSNMPNVGEDSDFNSRNG